MLEIPAGLLDVEGEDALTCAERELAEETGFGHTGMAFLGGVYLSPGFTDEYIHIFWARTDPAPRGTPETGIEVVRMPLRRGGGGGARWAVPERDDRARAAARRVRPGAAGRGGTAVLGWRHGRSGLGRSPVPRSSDGGAGPLGAHDRRLPSRPRSIAGFLASTYVDRARSTRPSCGPSSRRSARVRTVTRRPYRATSVARALSSVRSFHRFWCARG